MNIADYKGKNEGRIFVDVWTWALNAQELGRVPMEGIYRHTEALAKRYHPAIMGSAGEAVPYDGLAMIERVIGKKAEEFINFLQLKEKCSVWISIAADSVTPLLEAPGWPKSALRATIVHDLLALKGVFGAGNRVNFLRGASWSDVFLPVSETTAIRFENWLSENRPVAREYSDFIDYGCFHNFDKLPEVAPHELRGVGLGTWYPRKRIGRAMVLCKHLGISYHHIGRYAMPDSYEGTYIKHILDGLHFYGTPSDEYVQKLLAGSEYFFCMSEEEGFSMTPMEAIILGVPYIVLSDIAVHREIYGKFSVNFDRPKVEDGPFLSVSEQDRKAIFERYKFEEVIAPFESYLQKI